MPTPPRTARVIILLTLLAGAPAARADYFYNWGPTVPTLYSDNSGLYVVLGDEPHTGPVSGTQSMVATALTTYANLDSGPDTFNTGQQSGLRLDIIDGTSSGSVTFGLAFSGTMQPDGTGLRLDFLDGTTKPLTVNGHDYTVSLDLSSPVPGAIQATITPGDVPGSPPAVDPGAGGGVSNAPEPSALVLACLGLAPAASSVWRRWRGRRAA